MQRSDGVERSPCIGIQMRLPCEKSRRIKIAKHTSICYSVFKKYERDSQKYVPMDRLLSFG